MIETVHRFFVFVLQFFPPFFSWKYALALLTPLKQTIEMASGAIAVALLVGSTAGLWIAAGLPGKRLLYGVMAALRSVPDLTLAILCVTVVGIGPAAGMIALAIFYSAAIGKIFADLFLSADPAPLAALRATGAPRLSVALFGHLSLRLKDILSYSAYEFESAVRASVIVGAVGGGGLGTEIIGTINAVDYRRVTTLLLALILLVAVIDRFAYLLKSRPILVAVVFPFAALACWWNRPENFAAAHAAHTIAAMLPPSLPHEAVQQIPKLLGETLEIAGGGTFFAVLAAIPLGLCAARNVAPFFLAIPARQLLAAIRSIPEIVWGLLLVTAVGVGPRAGICALALHSAGSLGRLYAESLENVAQAPLDAIAATGASPVSSALFGFLPLAAAPIAVHSLFRLEWNVRAATVVGVIGAGGIGQALFNAQQLFFYQQMVAYILITWLLVLTVDQASSVLRRRYRLIEIHE